MLSLRSNKSRALGAAAAGLLAASLGASSVLAGSQPSPTTTGDMRAIPIAPLPVTSVPATTTASFAIFRDREATGMPAELVDSLASPQRFGRNAALAREISTVEGPGWVVPGNGYVCLVVPDPEGGHATSCNTIESARVRGVLVGIRDRNTGAGYSTTIVPDGAQATLATTSGSALRAAALPTTDGVVSLRVTGDQQVVVK